MRTFTYSDAKSHKFWNIEVTGKSYTVTYGRIGTDGQTKEKSFPSESAATAAADKLILEKTSKGYRETTASATEETGADATQKALEAAILSDPTDIGAHAAYADLLTEQGNPRGEFIQVQLALEDESRSADERKALQKREQELLKAHEAEWVGDWPTSVEPRGYPDSSQVAFPGPRPYRFIRGILAEINIEELTYAAAKALVDSPQTRMVYRMNIGDFAYEEDIDVDVEVDEDDEDGGMFPSMYAIVRWPYFGNIRHFQLGWACTENYTDWCDYNCHTAGEHAHDFVKQMPLLEELNLFAHRVNSTKIFAQNLPNLRVIHLYHCENYDLARLAKNASMKNLTKLACHPHMLEYGDEPYLRLPQLRALTKSEHLKKLTFLKLRCTDFGDDGCKELVKSGMLGQLEVLDLRHGRVSDKGARILVESGLCKNLKSLDLSRNELTSEGIELLNTLGIPVDTSYQHESTADMDEDQLTEVELLFQGDIE